MKFHYSRTVTSEGHERYWTWKLVMDNGQSLNYGVHFQSSEECLKSIGDFKAKSVDIPKAEIVKD